MPIIFFFHSKTMKRLPWLQLLTSTNPGRRIQEWRDYIKINYHSSYKRNDNKNDRLTCFMLTKNTIVFFFAFLQEKILLFVISWQEKKLLTCKNTTVCYLLTRETRKRRRSPWPRPTLSPMIGTNLLCKTGDWKPVITVCVHIHMFSSHTFCIWRNRLFHLGLVPKSSGIKYMVDANNGHPNIYSISIFGGWIFSGTTYSTVIVGSRKNAKAHPFPHDWHQLALQWPKNISNKSTLQHI